MFRTCCALIVPAQSNMPPWRANLVGQVCRSQNSLSFNSFAHIVIRTRGALPPSSLSATVHACCAACFFFPDKITLLATIRARFQNLTILDTPTWHLKGRVAASQEMVAERAECWRSPSLERWGHRRKAWWIAFRRLTSNRRPTTS